MRKFLLAAIWYAGLAGSALAAQPSTPVVVTNPAGQPVPTAAQGTTTVSGSVSITGTPTVNVASVPIVQAQDLDSPARHRWSTNLDETHTSYTVPAGQVLTVEYVSLDCSISSSTPPSPWWVEGLFTNTLSFYLPPVPYSSSFGGQDIYEGAAPVRLYYGPGTAISALHGSTFCAINLSGYLIPQ
jgi:hypothetical protein